MQGDSDGSGAAAIRQRLRDLRAALAAESAADAAARRPVELDQQSVGRLSRMDALQHQAMARAQDARRDRERRRIDAALARLDAGDYGFCTDCGEEIAEDRLARDPAVPRCLSCMRG